MTWPLEPDGWYDDETGNWDKSEPDMPAFMTDADVGQEDEHGFRVDESAWAEDGEPDDGDIDFIDEHGNDGSPDMGVHQFDGGGAFG